MPSSSDDVPAALYRRDGDRCTPSALTGGPWAPGVQAGSATCALLAWGVEQVPTLGPMRTVRYTFDLFRPAPMHAITMQTSLLRQGKRIQVVETVLLDGEQPVGCCRALRLRRGSAAPPVPENPDLPRLEVPPPPGEKKWTGGPDTYELPGIMGAFDARSVRGDDPSWSTTTWLRLLVPVVEATPTPPVVALAAVADFVSNSASHADPTEWAMVNADVSVDIVREPASEWMATVVRTTFADDGIGHSLGHIYDEYGVVASAMTMGLVDRHG